MADVYLLIFAWLGNPLYSLFGGPCAGAEVRLDAKFTARIGERLEERVYHTDDDELVGLYYGRAHQIGTALGDLADRFVDDLAASLAAR
jgi:hypothetical protein